MINTSVDYFTDLSTLQSSVLKPVAAVYYDRLLFRTVIVITSNLFFGYL